MSNTAHVQLKNARQRINEIDAGILSLLDERMKLALEIAEMKRSIGKPVVDESREDELYAELLRRNSQTILPDEKVLEIWGKIVELSRKIQEGTKK